MDKNDLERIIQAYRNHPSVFLISDHAHREELRLLSHRYVKKIFLLAESSDQVQLESDIAGKTQVVNSEGALQAHLSKCAIKSCRNAVQRYKKCDNGLANLVASTAGDYI